MSIAIVAYGFILKNLVRKLTDEQIISTKVN